jgi:Flp pilus assembly protein CpaB
VYWLQRPPYLRRTAAVLLVILAFVFFNDTATTEIYTVAARPIAAGTQLSDDDIAWVDVPVNALHRPSLDGGAIAARSITPGEPLTQALISPAAHTPDEWWTVPIEVGELAMPGDEIMLVVSDPHFAAVGVVVESQRSDRFSLDYRPAAVAVPPESAARVAAAEREGKLITAVRTTEHAE